MKKTIFLFILCFSLSNSYGQITIDPTAIQRLIQLKNLLQKAKSQLAQLQNDVKQNAGTKMNTASLIEIHTKIEDILRTSDEYVKIAFSGMAYSDIESLKKLGTNLKGKFSSNLKASTWKIDDFTPFLDGNSYSQTSGSDFLDKLTAGISLDNKGSSSNFVTYASNHTDYLNRIYALQTGLQKKKIQQALTYYKMADELEKKASALSGAVSSKSGGSPFTIQNQGIFNMGDGGNDTSIFGDLFNSSNIFGGSSMPSFGSSSPIVVNGQPFVMDASANVYDQSGKLVGNDIAFGAVEQAIQRAQQEQSDKSLWQSLTSSSPDVIKYTDEIIKQRIQAQGQAKATEIQNNIIQKMFESSNSNATDFTSNLFNPQASSIGFGSKSGLRMTTGERISANQAAMDMLTKAQELREKGDNLMAEALKRTDEQKSLDAVWQNQMFRNTLSKISL